MILSPPVLFLLSRLSSAGFSAYAVGGCVRDSLLGKQPHDWDLCTNALPEETKEVFSAEHQADTGLKHGTVTVILDHIPYEITTFRTDGDYSDHRHPDSVSFVDRVDEDLARRDFTINALMRDVLTGEIIDPFGGVKDLQDKILRCVDERTFAEDPLRVLRCGQFASRFRFSIDQKTLELCKSIDLSTLHAQRVNEELEKALLKADTPSIFFTSLRDMDQLSYWFKELEELIGLKQDPIYHPEGDVFTHTMEVLDRGAKYRDKVKEPYAFMLLCLSHDLGKIVTTETINGRIHAYGHEIEGLPLLETFYHRFLDEKEPLKYILNMTPLHMRPFSLASANASIKSTNRMFDEAMEPEDLIYFSLADKGERAEKKDIDYLFARYEIYKEYMARDYVKGKDLIDAGLKPDGKFSDILAYAHKLRLAGVDKDSALKQTLAYARKL